VTLPCGEAIVVIAPRPHGILLLLAIAAGCGRSQVSVSPAGLEAEANPALIVESARQHDFGAVIARPGRKMVHPYRLVNSSGQEVNILEVINRNTCCGIVRARTGILRPGDAVDVEVTLMVADRFGEVVHETEVVTDLPSDSSIVLRTAAGAIPVVRVENSSSEEGTMLIGAGEPRRAEFRAFVAGTSAEPPVDLSLVELRSTIKVDWVGPKQESPPEDGLQVESRRFAAWLDPGGPPGERRAEILLRDGNQVLDRHVVDWEVVSPIMASPRMIVMGAGQGRYRVLVESRDRKLFRIIRVQCNLPGIKARAVDASAAVRQSVELEGAPRPSNGSGVVTLFTDHPAQAKVDVPFVVID
jgi:hypothetical protein